MALWLVANAQSLPTALIPDIAKAFQAWLISTQNQDWPVNAGLVGLLFEWLALIEEAMIPRMWRDAKDLPPGLNIPHLRDVRDDIRMTAFTFAPLNAEAAERYLKTLDPDAVRHHEMQAILQAPASLARPRPQRSRALRSARSLRRMIRTIYIAARAIGLGRLACTTTFCRRLHQARDHSLRFWRMRRRKACA